MRVLLDEHRPADLALELRGPWSAVAGQGSRTATFFQRMRGHYDVLVTMDRSLGFQQNISALPFGAILISAPSNRMLHLRPLVPAILDVIAVAQPGRLHPVGA